MPTPSPTPTPTAEERAAAHLSEIIPWFTNPTDDYSSEAAERITDIWLRDADLGDAIARFPWLTDGVDYTEAFVPRFLQELAAIDIELTRTAASLPLLADKVDTNEPGPLGSLKRMASMDIELARLVVAFHWFSVDVTLDKLAALQYLESIAVIDIELAMLVARAPWLADDLTGNEKWALNYLSRLADDGHLELAKLLAGAPWFADGRDRDLYVYVLNSLLRIARSPQIDRLTAQPWFADGLNDQDAAFVVTLKWPATQDLTLYEDLLQAHFMQTRTVSLPLAGDVNIWVVQNAPFPTDDDVVDVIEGTARISEEFMGVPFPTTDIILLVVVHDDGSTYKTSRGGFHFGYMVLTRYKEDKVWSTVHETAHYYSVGPRWFREGGAEFINAYFNDLAGGQDLADRATEVASYVKQDCINGSESIENIWHLIHIYERRPKSICHYTMGEAFLLSAYATIGEDAMSSAMRELYLSEEEKDQLVIEQTIYDAFLKHAPADRKEAFRDLYRRLHGGPYVYPDDSFSDDHGDEAAGASTIEVGEVVEGVLDYRSDVDYFRFRVQEGQKYRINVNHGSLHFASITLYAENDWLIPQIENWVSRSSEPSGPEMLWIAPSSDEFYFVVRNIGGDSGTYTLTITPVDN